MTRRETTLRGIRAVISQFDTVVEPTARISLVAACYSRWAPEGKTFYLNDLDGLFHELADYVKDKENLKKLASIGLRPVFDDDAQLRRLADYVKLQILPSTIDKVDKEILAFVNRHRDSFVGLKVPVEEFIAQHGGKGLLVLDPLCFGGERVSRNLPVARKLLASLDPTWPVLVRAIREEYWRDIKPKEIMFVYGVPFIARNVPPEILRGAEVCLHTKISSNDLSKCARDMELQFRSIRSSVHVNQLISTWRRQQTGQDTNHDGQHKSMRQ